MSSTPVARTIRRTIVRDGLQLFEAAYGPHALLAEHEHDSPFFTYVLRGEYLEHMGQCARHCRRGAVILHHQSEVHSNAVGACGTVSLNVEIPEELWCELTSDVGRKQYLVGPVLSGDVEWAAFAVWREFHHDDDASTLGLGESVALLFAQLMKSHARGSFEPHRRLDRCIEYLSSHNSEMPTLAQVARVADVHPMHLAKLFRKRFGYSMGEWLRRQRIAWACDQLSRGTETISAIAFAAGFADHAHFTRTFHRVTGSTPRWYRNHSRGTSPRIPEQTLQSLGQHPSPA